MSTRDEPSFGFTHQVRDDCLCLHVQRTARALARRFDDAFRPIGLTQGQFSLLTSLNRAVPPTIGDVATLLAAQTTLGAATVVLETGEHPAQLKDTVTTPAGCTIDGILELEEGKLRVTLIKAVVKAAQRAKELANS